MVDVPKILVIADLPGWAWEHKAKQLQKHLSHLFHIDVACLNMPGYTIPSGYDLYHTFEVYQVPRLPTGLPLTTGMTAHVMQTWETNVGPGTVAKWSEPALALHANSLLLQKEYSELVQRPVHYVPNGVDETFFRRTRPHPDGSLRVGFVGKAGSPRKGYEIVKKACEKSGAVLCEVQRRARNALPLEGMLEFYQGIHVLAVSSDFDGTPNPALEAAACECAIVSNRIGNMPEFIEHGVNGLLTERTVENLIEALLVFDKNVGLAIEMGRAARGTVHNAWTWKQNAHNYAKMWRGALSK